MRLPLNRFPRMSGGEGGLALMPTRISNDTSVPGAIAQPGTSFRVRTPFKFARAPDVSKPASSALCPSRAGIIGQLEFGSWTFSDFVRISDPAPTGLLCDYF